MSRTDYTLIPPDRQRMAWWEEDFIGILVEDTGRMNYRNNRHWTKLLKSYRTIN